MGALIEKLILKRPHRIISFIQKTGESPEMTSIKSREKNLIQWLRRRDDESLHNSEGNKHQGNTKYPPITAVTRDSGGNQIVFNRTSQL